MPTSRPHTHARTETRMHTRAHTHTEPYTPGQSEPFIESHGEEQVQTDSNTCYRKVCSPSLSLVLIGLGLYCSPPVLTSKVFLDFSSSYKNNGQFIGVALGKLYCLLKKRVQIALSKTSSGTRYIHFLIIPRSF